MIRVLMGLGYYEVGGFKTVIDNLSKYLPRYGVEVTVAARVVRVKPPSYVNLVKLTPGEFLREAKHFDIIHIHQSYPYLSIVAKAKLTNVVFTSHGFPPIWVVPGVFNKLTHIYVDYIGYKLIFRKYKPVTTAISMYVRNQLKNMYNLNSILIPNGIDLTLFKPSKDAEKPGYPTIINVTSYNRFKGSDILLRSFMTIKRKYPEAKLIARNLSKAERLPNSVKKDVIDLDFLPYEELPKWYANADFYLLTSRWESFGLPILEAFASGIPVIAWDRPDARREHIISSGAGLLFRDSKSLLEAVDEILRNWQEYSRKGINYAQRFGWDLVAREYVKLYEEVLSNEDTKQ
jgi:glycosyltransferase involved in cell wall biosynthesis